MKHLSFTYVIQYKLALHLISESDRSENTEMQNVGPMGTELNLSRKF